MCGSHLAGVAVAIQTRATSFKLNQIKQLHADRSSSDANLKRSAIRHACDVVKFVSTARMGNKSNLGLISHT